MNKFFNKNIKIDLNFFLDYNIINKIMDLLNEKQKQAYNAMNNGLNIFISGPGGSGKSHVINLFVQNYKQNKEDNKNKLYVTSSTGLSSLLINGITINQYSGIGTGAIEVDYYGHNKCLQLWGCKINVPSIVFKHFLLFSKG